MNKIEELKDEEMYEESDSIDSPAVARGRE